MFPSWEINTEASSLEPKPGRLETYKTLGEAAVDFLSGGSGGLGNITERKPSLRGEEHPAERDAKIQHPRTHVSHHRPGPARAPLGLRPASPEWASQGRKCSWEILTVRKLAAVSWPQDTKVRVKK